MLGGWGGVEMATLAEQREVFNDYGDGSHDESVIASLMRELELIYD